MELCTIPATSTLPLQLPALQSFYIESTGMKILKKWQLQGYRQFLILTQSAQQEDTVLPDEDETSKSFAILDFIFNLIQNKSRWQKKNVYAMGN